MEYGGPFFGKERPVFMYWWLVRFGIIVEEQENGLNYLILFRFTDIIDMR
ncbi:MAG: hypothetical protein HFE64_08825 [Lachnospiraceae bacterium]|jgi:hypothetical protein|nr:hypothetical protein [Lachnospiraceae bacterium]